MLGIALITATDAKDEKHSPVPAALRKLCGKPVEAYAEEMLGRLDGLTVLKSAQEITSEIRSAASLVLIVAGDAPFISDSSCMKLIDGVRDTDEVAVLRDQDGAALACCMRPTAVLCNGSAAEMLRQSIKTAKQCLDASEEESVRIRSCADFAKASAMMRARIHEKLMQSGVVLIDPKRTIIDGDVVIGRNTVIYPGCILENGTVIGENCTLYAGCRLDHAHIGNGVTIENSVILDASVADHTTVGPFAYIRPQTHVGENCRIGDFVELKNSQIGNGTKVSHLTYVGDSDLGEQINLGCGVVFVNYDGKRKQRSTVGDRAFIGCNVNLVAPVQIGNDAYIAAGSTVTCDVPDGAMLIARERETIKAGWVDARRQSGKL